MMYEHYNPNPSNKYTGDCVIRAICAATNSDWETVYIKLALRGFMMHEMPSSNAVWDAQLISEGFVRAVIPNTCPNCYTVKDFCRDHVDGKYILGTGTHAVAVINGKYYDAWDSGEEIPTYFYRKEY